jgi:hypothetical protein
VEPRSLLVTCHDPSTFRKIGSKNATNFGTARKRYTKLSEQNVLWLRITPTDPSLQKRNLGSQ